MSDFPPPQSDPSGYSNYPRDPYGMGGQPSQDPYRRPPGVYFDSINLAWKLVQQNLATWVLAILVAGVIYYAVAIPMQIGLSLTSVFSRSSDPFDAGRLLLSAAVGFLLGCFINVLGAGLMNMGLKTARNERIALGDMFSGFSMFGSVLLGSLITTLAVDIGFVLLLVPGIFLLGLFVLVPLIIVDQKLGPIEAIQLCVSTLRQHAFALFGLVFVAGLVAALGACLCGFGVLFTMPVYFVTMGLAYNNFFPRAPIQYGYQPIGQEPPR